MLRDVVVFCLLLSLKVLSRIFYRLDVGWIGETPEDPWADLRLVVFLHHTSLFEVLYLGCVPARTLWRLARHGVVPGADKTLDRPLVGRFYRLVAGRVISITRRRDATWKRVLDAAGPEALVALAPEGRMMRRNGLDSKGEPMTVRGGVADLLERLDGGRLLIVYSGGLHHVQAPGEPFPRLFETLRIRFENLDLEAYRDARRRRAEAEGETFKAVVVRDLEARRDRHCPFVGLRPVSRRGSPPA